MDRRRFLQAGAGVLVVAATQSAGAPSGAASRPNLVVVMTDEQNFRTIGRYRALGHAGEMELWGRGNVVETPTIDSLAGEGMTAGNFYSTSPICTPARASFVTGLYPQNVGVTDNNDPLLGNAGSFAEDLRSAGYATGYSGKWHLDGKAKPGWAPSPNLGFDDNRYMFNRGHWKKLLDGPNGGQVGDDGKTIGDARTFTTDWLTQKTLDFIDANANRPFCYMVSYPDPHGPDLVRAPYDQMYSSMRFTKPSTSTRSQSGLPDWAKASKGGGRDSQANYYGMIRCIDDNLARIVDRLRSRGILDNTIIVFTADHGDMRGEHGRRNKNTPLEASAKVPFIVRYPGHVPQGAVTNEVLSGIDFSPTILGLMGVTRRGAVDGRDASTLLRGQRASSEWSDIIFTRGRNASWVSTVDQRHKLVFEAGSKPWLLDRVSNPDETVNYYKDRRYRSVRRELANATIDYAETTNDPAYKNKKVKRQMRSATR